MFLVPTVKVKAVKELQLVNSGCKKAGIRINNNKKKDNSPSF